MKVDIFRVLNAIDLRNYDFYDNLSEVEKKEVSPYVLLRWVSSVNGNKDTQEYFIEMVNELVNKDHWVLSKNHKGLLWKLYAGCGIGTKVKHQYLKAGSKEKAVKIEKLLADLYPAMKMSDIKLMASMMTKEDKNELFDKMGFDKKQRKEYE